MAALHIRDMDAHTVEKLKRRAQRNHRSLQGELRAILEEAANASSEVERKPLALKTVSTGRRKPIGREEIYGDSGR